MVTTAAIASRDICPPMQLTHIWTALLNADTTKTGYAIRFRNTQLAETAHNNTKWLHKLSNDTKPVKPLFGIIMHRTPTEDDLEGNKRAPLNR